MIMSQKILQINFNFSGISMAELKQAWLPGAQPIADTPGLCWKIWLMNEAKSEVGGIYLFDAEASVQAFLAGPIVAEIKNDPSLSNISVKQFDIIEEHTVITHGPVREESYRPIGG
jgi:hypothetical protein